MLQARLEVGDLEGLIIIFGKRLSCKMRGTLEIGVFVAIAIDLVLILRGKGLQAVTNGNEAEMDETGLEAEGKGNGRKSVVLLNLKDTTILYELLNLLLWLRQMKSSKTYHLVHTLSGQIRTYQRAVLRKQDFECIST